MDPELFRLSRDYVGDTAETIALVWDEASLRRLPPPYGERVGVRGSDRRHAGIGGCPSP